MGSSIIKLFWILLSASLLAQDFGMMGNPHRARYWIPVNEGSGSNLKEVAIGAPSSLVGITATNWNTGTLGPEVILDGSTEYALIGPAGYINICGSSWEVPGGFTSTGLTYDSTDNAFWIGDFTNSKLIKTTTNGVYITEVSISAQPQGVAYDSSDNTLWWSDNSGQALRHINKDGTDAGGSIMGLGYDPNGCAYEPASDSIWIVREIAPPGTQQVSRYSCASGALQETLNLGAAITVADGVGYHASTDRLWVTDDHSNTTPATPRMHEVNAGTGAVVATWDISPAPEDVAIVGNEVYYAADAEFHASIPDGNRIHWFTARTTENFTFTLQGYFTLPDATEVVFARGNATSAGAVNVGWGLFVTTAGNLRLIMRDGQAGLTADRAITTNAYHFTSLVVNRSAGIAQIYIDGAKAGADISLTTLTKSVDEMWRRTSIGQSIDGDTNRFYPLRFGRILIHNEALTAGQIAALHK